MTKDEALDKALEAAYLAGFNASGEGYNGEYPFRDHGAHPEQNAGWIKNRDSELNAIKQARSAPVQEPVAIPHEWRKVLRKLAFMARTSGGTVGHDSGLSAACEEAEALLSKPYATQPAAQPAPVPDGYKLVPVEHPRSVQWVLESIEAGNYVSYQEAWKDLLTAAFADTTPPAQPAPVQAWINPNDKNQHKFLPEIGDKVLFCNSGRVYYGHHTGGGFRTGQGVATKYFGTWDCHWMPIPSAHVIK
jgi:hypothetical protein